MACEQSQTVLELEDARQQFREENDELKLTVRKLMDRLYGRRSERFLVDPDQLPLDFGSDEDGATVEALAEAVLEAERTLEEVESRRKAKRRKQRDKATKSSPLTCRVTKRPSICLRRRRRARPSSVMTRWRRWSLNEPSCESA